MEAYEEFKYLFPFEHIKLGSKVIIYGAGDVGVSYLKQMQMTQFADVVCFVDRDYQKMTSFVVPIYPPEKLHTVIYDYIVLAFKMGTAASDVRRRLISSGIPDSKIIFQGARTWNPVHVVKHRSNIDSDESKMAFNRSDFTIAIKIGSGLGDAIIKKRLYIEISKLMPGALIDIYVPEKGSGFVSSIYGDQANLNKIISDSGMIYSQMKRRYSIAMTIFHLIEIDYVDWYYLETQRMELANLIKKHVAKHKAYGVTEYPPMQRYIHFLRSKYKGWNCYSVYNYTDVFNINDMNVTIPLDLNKRIEYDKLNLGEYITFNYGNGITSNDNKENISKQWPKDYFLKFVNLFSANYPRIKVVQLGDSTVDKVPNVDKAFLGKNLELVKYILHGSMCHLDSEGGLVHLATQLGTKCVTIFGPTQKYIYGYPQNENISAGECHGCYCLYENTYQCAKGLERPSCMRAVTPEMAFASVSKIVEAYNSHEEP